MALHIAGMPTDATLYQGANVDAKTAAGYEQLLENLYVLTQVPAWSSNRLSRLTKAAKRYSIDTGLAAAAANLTLADILADSGITRRFFDAFAAKQLRPELALMYPRPAHITSAPKVDGERSTSSSTSAPEGVVALEFKAGAAPPVHDVVLTPSHRACTMNGTRSRSSVHHRRTTGVVDARRRRSTSRGARKAW